MVQIVLDIRQSVDENARHFFEAAKKARRKAQGASKTILLWRQKLAAEQARNALVSPLPQRTASRRTTKREWFEKFRWCRSSDNFLLVAGRDASTNEALIKHHTQSDDIVFHTDMAGSPFVVVKADSRQVPETTMNEAAQFCASYSRAWKNGLSALEVFHVAPSQVTKEPNPGEFLSKGAFVIRGKTLYRKPLLAVAVGVDPDGKILAGPPAAVLAHTSLAFEILQGNEKTSDVAKLLLKRLNTGELDELVGALPPGGCRLGKELRRTLS